MSIQMVTPSVELQSLTVRRDECARLKTQYETRAASAAGTSLALANLRGAEAMERLIGVIDKQLRCARLGIRWRLSRRRGGFAW